MHSLQEDHRSVQVWSLKLKKYEKSFKKVAKSKKKKKNASGKMQALEKDHRSASLEFKVCCKKIR